MQTFQFSGGNKVSNPVHCDKGTYELKDDVLTLIFENDNETLELGFNEFKESDIEISTYSAVMPHLTRTNDPEDANASPLKHLLKLSESFSEGQSIEFIEK